jgi:hypothetical protein
MRIFWVIESEPSACPHYVALRKNGTITYFTWVDRIDAALQFSRKEDAVSTEEFLRYRQEIGFHNEARGTVEHISESVEEEG